MNPGIRILSLQSANCLLGGGDEQVEVKETFYPSDEKLSLKADESQFGLRHGKEMRILPHYFP